MTITTTNKTYPINENFDLFIEGYRDKPDFLLYWRYGLIDKRKGYSVTYKGGLLSRPKPKRCIDSLQGMIY